MFDNKRIVTCGISDKIPAEIQLGLWIMIDNIRNNGGELDYIQVFRLSAEGMEQRIIHTQEQPAYRNEIILPFLAPTVGDAKIFVIDNGGYSTMMLAGEY